MKESDTRMPKQKILSIIAIIILTVFIFAIFAGAFIWVLSYSKLFGEKEIFTVAQEIKGNETNPKVILNDIAEWLSKHMTYDTRAIYYYPTFPFLLCRQMHPDAAWIMTIKRGACEEYAILCCELSRLAGIQSRIAYNTAEDHVWCEVFINNSWIHFDPGLSENKRFNNSGYYEHPRPDGWGKQLSFVFITGPNGEKVDVTKGYTDTGRLIVRVERDSLPLENASARALVSLNLYLDIAVRINKSYIHSIEHF